MKAIELCLSAVLGFTAVVARADVVSAQERPIAVGVKITALKDGQLYYETDEGAVQRPIEQIRYLQISGWDAFNQAEKQQRDEQIRPAIAGYEKILESGVEAGTDAGPDRGLLVRCRLIRLYDAAGEFEAAVSTYLAVVQAMPAVVETLRPAHVPTDGPQLVRAARLVKEAVAQRDRTDPVALSLESWRSSWPRGAEADERPPATQPAAVSPPPADTISPPVGAELGELGARVEAGRFDEVLKQVAAAARSAAGSLPAEMYYWQGRAYLGKAGQSEAPEARANRQRAGLAFMRVVIGAPDDPLAAECLYRAGEVCRDEGRTDRAAALWAELIAGYPSAAPWAQQARQAMERIKLAATAPAR